MSQPKQELEDGERQAKLAKWIPYLWIAPVALILLLAGLAYCGR